MTVREAENNPDPFRVEEESRSKQRPGCTKVLLLLFLAMTVLVIIGLAITIGPVFSLLWQSGAFEPNPTDQEIVRLLSNHAEDFDRLMAMMDEDMEVQQVHPSYFRPENTLSDERWHEYQQMFEKIGLDAGVGRWEDDGYHFVVSARGLVTGGSFKGLAYRTDQPAPLFPSMDSPTGLQPNRIGYRPIGDNWYILYSYDP